VGRGSCPARDLRVALFKPAVQSSRGKSGQRDNPCAKGREQELASLHPRISQAHLRQMERSCKWHGFSANREFSNGDCRAAKSQID